YKVFAARFMQQYQLSGMLDTRTSDVTRACFISHDPQALFRAEAEPIKLEEYINPNDYDASAAAIHQAEAELNKHQPPAAPDPLSKEALEEIIKRLGGRVKVLRQRTIYLPPEVDAILPRIEEELKKYGIAVVHTEPINYGRKIKVQNGIRWAELNIFYGKRGYSIVRTPKTGSDEQLAEVAAVLVWQILSGGS
ncbi:MAG: hypothetical protein NZL95_01095, partial [Chitinophagales bacterium]|nr:hypothetical protein [Chitinophagales bacterium]MDW8427132.1 BT4734/BF3469 family protein [Chitinophagales bacterium]